MGSVVLDAVNSFFGHSPSHPHDWEAPRAHDPSPKPPKRSRAPSQNERPMSQRTSSSSATRTVQRERAPSYNARTPSRTSQRNEQEPPEPPLAARSAPPSEALQATAQPNGTPVPGPADTRSARPQKIKVRDLEHIQSFASEDMGAFSEIRSRSRSRSRGDDSPQYEISEMKVEHIIEMVAGLLTKITTTNDQQHEHLHRQPPPIENTGHLDPQTNSVLAFHGKNVPSITILSYLSRINKYCPTSYEVFLSLLVYFDRMTEKVNAGPMAELREANQQAHERNSAGSSSESLASDKMEGVMTASTPDGAQTATPPESGSMEKAVERGVPGTPHSRPREPESPSIQEQPVLDTLNLSHFFVVDSFNIHRLVIAGVTCASKFFSDIFYTNSRYAKVSLTNLNSELAANISQVGGLPLPELNHLELQFLLLNDFRLSVPVEEIEAYGTMLVEFYAREVVAQQKAAEAMQTRSLSESSTESTATVRAAG